MNKIVILAFIFCSSCVFSSEQSNAIQPVGETISLSDGSTLTNAIIKRADPDGLVIEYDDSLKKYSFEKLSDDIKKKYNYDKDKAAEYKLASIRGQQAFLKQQVINQRAPVLNFYVIQALPNGALATILGDQNSCNPLSRVLVYIEGLTSQFDGNKIRLKSYRDPQNGEYKYTTVNGEVSTIPKLTLVTLYK